MAKSGAFFFPSGVIARKGKNPEMAPVLDFPSGRPKKIVDRVDHFFLREAEGGRGISHHLLEGIEIIEKRLISPFTALFEKDLYFRGSLLFIQPLHVILQNVPYQLCQRQSIFPCNFFKSFFDRLWNPGGDRFSLLVSRHF